MFNHLSSPNTRELILDFLSNRAACCDDLSQALHLTKPDIQYHLNALHSKGMITEIKLHNSISSRGRPKKYYQTDFSLQNKFSQDLHQIFLLLLKDHQVDRSSLLQQVSTTLFGEARSSNNYMIALQNLIKNFHDRHYQPRWEIRSTGIVIHFSNCPFKSFIKDTDFFCKLDELTIENHTGFLVSKTHCQRLMSQHFCQFMLTPK